MDDWIILAKSKEYLHKILSVMNNVLRELKLDLASSKSYKGQVIHGFNFLGFYFCSNFYNTPSINGTLAFLAKLFQKNVRYDALNYFVAWRAWVKGCLLYKPKIYYKQILIWLSLLKIGVLEISLIFCAYMIDLSMKVFI